MLIDNGIQRGNCDAVCLAQFLHKLLKTVGRDAAHLHSTDSKHGTGGQCQVKMPCGILRILTVDLEKVAHLEQHDIIGMVMLDIVIGIDILREQPFAGLHFVVLDTLFGGEVSVVSDQTFDTRNHLFPRQFHISAAALLKLHALGAVLFPATSRNGMRGTAGAIFVFQEVAFLFGVVRLGEKGIDAALAALNVATSCNGGVDLVVGNEHTGLFNLCHVGGVLSAGQAVVRQIVQNSLRIIQTEAHETVVLLVCGGISGQFTDQLLTESRVFQSFSHALGCIRESSLSAICKAWHKALLSGSFTHVAVVIQKRFSHPCTFKALGFHDLHIGGVLAHLHELTDALGSSLPGDYLCRSGVTGAAPLCQMDTILTIPSGELTMVGFETGTADILLLKSNRNLCC